jgi:phosphoglycerol transferase MdoB-like AlkP superfamily enzyme
MARLKPLFSNWIAPMLGVVALYAAFQAGASWALGVSIDSKAIPADLALHLVLGFLLLCMARNRWTFLLLVTVLMAFLHVGNAIKLSVLGGPIMPDDALALRSLLLLLSGWWFALAAVFLALAGAALVLAFNFRPWRARIAGGVLATLVVALFMQPEAVVSRMDKEFGNVVWNQRGNYLSRGPLVHTIQESARYAKRADSVPDKAAVAAAAEILQPSVHLAAARGDVQPTAEPLTVPVKRNVHVILLETFWDPSVLTKAEFSRDPFAADFRELWAESGNSRALVPVFGGYTANSEFEALCGFPVTQDWVVFEGRLRNQAPCLPRTLQEAGYTTLASHPNIAAFWNRVNAYERVGFNVFWSSKDFERDDMNGNYLGDASLYRQVLDKIDPLLETNTPTFNYILTFFGHLEYPLNEKRPVVVHAPGADPVVEKYANTVYYKSRELMDFLGKLREKDPEAVVVIFGDHLPFLGANLGAYAQSGLLASDREDFDEGMFRTQYSTPLVIIDGRNGPVKLGAVPLYRVPSIVLSLLQRPEPSVMDMTRMPADMVVRPLPGLNVVMTPDGSVKACRDPKDARPACTAAVDWLESVGTVGADIFWGRQHVLRDDMLPARAPYRQSAGLTI